MRFFPGKTAADQKMKISFMETKARRGKIYFSSSCSVPPSPIHYQREISTQSGHSSLPIDLNIRHRFLAPLRST